MMRNQNFSLFFLEPPILMYRNCQNYKILGDLKMILYPMLYFLSAEIKPDSNPAFAA